jgi:hypothetical protein
VGVKKPEDFERDFRCVMEDNLKTACKINVLQAACPHIKTPKLPDRLHLTITDVKLNLYGGTLGTAATTVLVYQPRMIGGGGCGEIGGMITRCIRRNKFCKKKNWVNLVFFV